MAERIPIPSENTSCNWADGGTYPATDPGDPARAAGFKPKDFPVAGTGAIVPAEDHNFLWRLGMEMITWLRDSISRAWGAIPEGLAATVVGDVFRVVPMADGSAYARMGEMYSVAPGTTGGGNPSHICTDSNRVFFLAGTSQEYIGANNPTTGALDWEVRPSSGNVPSALCCDGDGIYYTFAAVNNGLYRRDPDGTTETSGGSYKAHTQLRANGAYVVGIGGDSGVDDLEIWTAACTPTFRKSTGSGALTALAIDQTQGYCATSTRAPATKDVFAYTLSTGALVWSVQIDATAPTIRAMAADGDHVYVLADSYNLAGGATNQALFCLDRTTGLVLWSTIVDGTNMAELAADHKYIYVINSADDLYQMPKDRIEPGMLAVKSQMTGSLDADGVSVFSRDAGSTDIRRVSNGEVSTSFYTAKSDDPNRRPWAKLATPTSTV